MKFRALFAVICAVCALAGCNSDPSSEASPASAPGPTQGPGPAPDAPNQHGGSSSAGAPAPVPTLADAQLCLQNGDVDCARRDYARLSQEPNDAKESDAAFSAYASAGVNLGSFKGQFDQPIDIITELAASLSTQAGQATRLQIFRGYQHVTAITEPTLRGLTRYVGGLALAAEVLAEGAQVKGHYAPSDLAADPEACENAGVVGCAKIGPDNPCRQPDHVLSSGTVLAGGGDALSAADEQEIAPSFATVLVALEAAQQGRSEMGPPVGQSPEITPPGAAVFIADIDSGQGEGKNPSVSPCFRQLLLNDGVGTITH